MNKMKILFLLDWETKCLFVESFILLAWARLLKFLPFAKVAPSLGKKMEDTSIIPNQVDFKVIVKVSQAIHIMSKYTFWESQCLVKAIAGMKMLEKRKIASTLYLGAGKDDQGRLVAHAWLRSGPFYVTGAEGMENFTVVGKFAKTIGGVSNERM